MLKVTALLAIALILSACAGTEAAEPRPGPDGTEWPELARCLDDWGRHIARYDPAATATKSQLVALASATCAVSAAPSKPPTTTETIEGCYQRARSEYRKALGYLAPSNTQLTVDESYAAILCGPSFD